jgi:hypothetical protein
MPFDGETYNENRDKGRLQRQLTAIKAIMMDHKPHTLAELAKEADCMTTSASARVRDLRKAKHGSHTIMRRCLGGGLWEYTLVH